MTSKNKTSKSPDIIIDISVPCPHWPDMTSQIEKAVLLTLEKAEFESNTPVEVSLVLADNVLVQDLNKTYRGKDKPTNVLSFPQKEESSLGDVILAYETVRDEASEQDKKFEHHILHMVIHGVLHLVGRDHENEDEAEAMEALEAAILRDFGIKNPYEI